MDWKSKKSRVCITSSACLIAPIWFTNDAAPVLYSIGWTTILPSFKEMESKLRTQSKAKEISYIHTDIHTFSILVLGVMKRGLFWFHPLPGHFLENLTGFNRDFWKSWKSAAKVTIWIRTRMYKTDHPTNRIQCSRSKDIVILWIVIGYLYDIYNGIAATLCAVFILLIEKFTTYLEHLSRMQNDKW